MAVKIKDMEHIVIHYSIDNSIQFHIYLATRQASNTS